MINILGVYILIGCALSVWVAKPFKFKELSYLVALGINIIAWPLVIAMGYKNS
jgi:hypothetical protein